jgi:RNA recognition motif-containing protein
MNDDPFHHGSFLESFSSSEKKEKRSRPQVGSNSVLITNLSPMTREKDILDLFGSIGDIISCSIHFPRNRMEIARGVYATVVYAEDEHAEGAVSTLNDHNLYGNELVIVLGTRVESITSAPRNRNDVTSHPSIPQQLFSLGPYDLSQLSEFTEKLEQVRFLTHDRLAAAFRLILLIPLIQMKTLSIPSFQRRKNQRSCSLQKRGHGLKIN